MDMLDWARHEVELACKKEAPDRKDGEWDYGCACYESALKAYESLMADNHSGMSFGFTKNILIRLMEHKPLTPIEDVPEVWERIYGLDEDGIESYQCKRLDNLFKSIHPDGSVTYVDVDRTNVHEANSDTFWHNSMANRIINQMFPITMPYYPESKPYVVECEEYLTDRKNGDFDTVVYRTVKKPDGEVVPVFRYFADAENGMKEITFEEFQKRYKLHSERETREAREKREKNES